MGHFVTDEVDRIDLGDGYWVDIKNRMSYRDQQKLVAHYVKMADPKALGIDLEAGSMTLLTINIKAWNLVDADNKTVKLSREAIELLDPNVAAKIAEEINQRNLPPKA